MKKPASSSRRKFSKYSLAVVFLLACSLIRAQTLNHPTIDSVKVSYTAMLNDTLNLATGVRAMSQATISLKAAAGVSKIYFKIVDTLSNSTLYDVNYDLSSPAITDTDGNTLFQSNGNTIVISPGQYWMLKPYTYELKTEDSLHNQSILFSTLQ